MSQVEEIKSKLDIVDVIREYIPVKAVGVNFQALCPFHNEKTPSFVISPDKQIWHCFGCGRGGDVFSFVMEKEGLSFGETLRLLAPKAGVVLKYEKKENYSQRNRLLDILSLAGKYYNHILQSPEGRQALEYLHQRALSDATITEWQLGYSKNSWNDLTNFLKTRPLNGKKYSDEEIFLAGLSIKKEGTQNYYDRFRDRIMFPIWDINNNLIAFTARINPQHEKTTKMGKYINSPQTKLYDKSKLLFALNKAKEAIRKEDLVIVVEGQMDVISAHQHGFKNVVASSGTALTSEQVGLIKRFTNNIALLFDMDEAGQLAVDRGIKEALAQGMGLKIITLPFGKDPDECLRHDPKDFEQAIFEAKLVLDYYFTKISAGLDLNVLDNKIKVRDKMFVMINLVSNKTEQGYWLKKISEELGFFEDDVREEFVKWQTTNRVVTRREQNNNSEIQPVVKELNREDKLAELLLALLLKFPEFINYSTDNLEPEYLNENFARFYKDFIIYYNKTANIDYDSFRLYLKEQDQGAEKRLEVLLLLGEKDFYNYDSTQAKKEIVNIITELKKIARKHRIKRLQESISRAEKENKKEELNKLMQELQDLMTP